jgi:hypothetical protein
MIVWLLNNKMERVWMETVMAYFKALARQLPGENHDKPRPEQSVSQLTFKLATPEWKPKALPFGQICLVVKNSKAKNIGDIISMFLKMLDDHFNTMRLHRIRQMLGALPQNFAQPWTPVTV